MAIPGTGTVTCEPEYDRSPWWPLMELLLWCPIIKSSHCNSAEDLICHVVKSLKLIWGKALLTITNTFPQMSFRDLGTWGGIKIVTIAMAAEWYAMLVYWHLTVIPVTMMINQGTYFMHQWSLWCRASLAAGCCLSHWRQYWGISDC